MVNFLIFNFVSRDLFIDLGVFREVDFFWGLGFGYYFNGSGGFRVVGSDLEEASIGGGRLFIFAGGVIFVDDYGFFVK